MSRRINVCVVVLLVLLELTTSAMVLPRPPSSPNHIRQDQDLSARKALEGKSLHGVPRDLNAERPDVEDYRYRRPFAAAFYAPLFFYITDWLLILCIPLRQFTFARIEFRTCSQRSIIRGYRCRLLSRSRDRRSTSNNTLRN